MSLVPVWGLASAGIVLWMAWRFFQRTSAPLAQRGGKKPVTRKLSSYNDLEHHLRGNPHITHGYRQGYSLRETLRSIFEHHNESGNIWSHLVPTVVFGMLTVVNTWRVWALTSADGDALHAFLLAVYTVGCTNLCLWSTVFHILCCSSEEIYKLTAKLDYTGISLMILFSFFPMMYNLFFCHQFWGVLYTVTITVLTIMAVFVSWSKSFSLPQYNWVRAVLFVCVGLFGAVPTPHAAFLIGWEKTWPVVWPLVTMALLYITGAAIYATQIPERFFPGRLNHGWFASHFWFHIFAVVAASLHYWNIGRILAWRQATLTC